MLPSNKESKLSNTGNKNDYELFLQAFQKPTQIYKLLGYRHLINPLFLHRTTSYLKHRRTQQPRASRTLEEIVKELQKKVQDRERCRSKEGSFKLTITGIDNKCNASKLPDTYDIQLFLHKINFKEKPAAARADSPIANLKFSPPDKKCAAKSPSKMPSVATIRCSTLAKHSSCLGCMLELRVKLRSAKSHTISSKDSPPTKKRRCVEEWYSACVVVQNESQTSVLGDGSYTLFLRPLSPDKWKPAEISWETAPPKEDSTITTDMLDDDCAGCSSISFDVKSENVDSSSSSSSSHQSPKKTTSVRKLTRVPPEASPAKSEESKGVLMYNFLYNGNTMQQTECRRNRVCPWCNLDCRILYSLLEHITRCHPKFKVTFIPGLNGFDEIDVEINELLTLCQTPRPDEQSSVPIFTGPNVRAPFCLQMMGSLSRCKRSESDFMVLDIAPYKAPHSRLYFTSKSYEPILPHEFDYDSDVEEKMDWMEDKTKQLIKDFTDVNEAEKAIMILWNCFILRVRPLADQEVPSLVTNFVKEYGEDIIRRNLSKNLILHLTNLHSFGLLRPDDLEETVLQVYKMEEGLPKSSSSSAS